MRSTLSRVSIIRARLEGDINGNLQLVRGLVAAISAEPDMDAAALAGFLKAKSWRQEAAAAPAGRRCQRLAPTR